jgi:hypothetical protein
MTTNDIELALVVNNQPMREYQHEGRCYIESREGTSYGIRIKNNKGHQVKVVVSLDGLSILTGKPVSDNPEETGYILGAYAQETFKGYRLDDAQVAAFTFVKREKSYATENGEGAGNGVIGLRVYAEKEKKPDLAEVYRKMYEEERGKPREKEYIPYPVYPSYPSFPYWKPYWERPYHTDPFIYCGGSTAQGNATWTTSAVGLQGCASSMMNCSTDAGLNKSAQVTSQSVELKAQSFDMGSTFGGVVKETVTHTTFETGALIAELSIFYASIEGLKSMGIDVTRAKQVAMPEPFKRGYCQPPAGWSSGKA